MMPGTINGIGTHYYGKKNLDRRTEQCASCGRVCELLSYETRLFFTLLYMPVIPLGRKQIINFCTSCSRHQAMASAKYDHWKEETLSSTADVLAEKSDEAGAAFLHLGSLTQFREMDEAAQLAEAIEGSFGDDPDNLMTLASWFERFGTPADVDRCCDLAYQLDNEHIGAKRARAIGLMRSGSLDEAKSMLAELGDVAKDQSNTLWIELVAWMQNANRHQDAVAIMDEILERQPDLAKQAHFKKMVKASKKASGLEPQRFGRKRTK